MDKQVCVYVCLQSVSVCLYTKFCKVNMSYICRTRQSPSGAEKKIKIEETSTSVRGWQNAFKYVHIFNPCVSKCVLVQFLSQKKMIEHTLVCMYVYMLSAVTRSSPLQAPTLSKQEHLQRRRGKKKTSQKDRCRVGNGEGLCVRV